jgi:hypothetical protein
LRSSSRHATQEARRGTSRVLFAEFMLATVAILSVIWGLAAIAKSSFFVAKVRELDVVRVRVGP